MKLYDSITPELAEWIRAQPLFFNATAPLDSAGHINLSPRGLDSLRILDPKRVAILDLTGSGNETAAHLMENNRITIMFCAFSGEPRILRLYGEGEVILPNHADWPGLRTRFASDLPGVRQIFRIQVNRIQTSCGYGVPLMELIGQREDLVRWANKKGDDGIRRYQVRNNRTSIDGLPAPDMEENE
jgi:hypothetical protein